MNATIWPTIHDTFLAMLDPWNCVVIDKRDMWISIAQTFCTLHVHSEHTSQAAHQRCSEQFCSPTGWVNDTRHETEARSQSYTSFECRGNLFTQWVNKRPWTNHMSRSFKGRITTWQFLDSFGNGPIIRTSHPGGVNKKPGYFFKDDASQVRAWAITFRWTHPGDTVQWLKQILLALQLLQVWDRWSNISEQEGKNSLIRRLKTT